VHTSLSDETPRRQGLKGILHDEVRCEVIVGGAANADPLR
jgi:hypothetical protein